MQSGVILLLHIVIVRRHALCLDSLAEQCNRAAECRCQDMFPSTVEEVALVDTLSP
jgi:hypothetical protein